MTKKIILTLLLSLFIFTGCNNSQKYFEIDSKEALQMMKEDKDALVLDVRSYAEYKQGHIKNAINVPQEEIKNIGKKIPNKNAKILIYCNTGRRAKLASDEMIEMGYTKIYNFKGLQYWPYEVVK